MLQYHAILLRCEAVVVQYVCVPLNIARYATLLGSLWTLVVVI